MNSMKTGLLSFSGVAKGLFVIVYFALCCYGTIWLAGEG